MTVGGNTEAKNQYDTFGTMAYGGAGIVMSRGLFNAMDAMYDECTNRLKDTFGGDGMYTRWSAPPLNERVWRFTRDRSAAMAMGIEDAHAAVTPHPGLHQMDVPGDGTGFFQAGLPFVSLHHMWNGWTDAFGEGPSRRRSECKLTDPQRTSTRRRASARATET